LEADSGRQALMLLEKELPDLILLDLMMPEMNGYDVARLLRNNERTRDLPILVVSALALTWDIERAARAGLDDFLTKPFEPEELFARIEAALAARSASSD
jgi:CheY-like chemotaxis protein